MSDTLSDLSSWLPSEFLTAGDFPVNKTHFTNTLHRYPYNFGSPSSTESESDDDEHLTALTHRFTRSVSLQERLQITHPIQKKGFFSSSPESTLNWNLSSPATPVAHSDEDSWERIYAAADQIARMKMEMNMKIIKSNDDVFANRNLPKIQRGPPPNHHHHPNWMRENEGFIRQQPYLNRLSYCPGGGSGRNGTNRPVVFCQSAWPPQTENPRCQQTIFPGSGGGCGRPTAVVKKECAGTGVFLPRTSFPQGPPESKKKPACLGGHLPARVVGQSYNKNMGPINPQHQPNMYSGFSSHHQLPPHYLNRPDLAEIVMSRRHAAIQAQQRRTTHPVGVPEAKVRESQEVVLPQEWTY